MARFRSHISFADHINTPQSSVVYMQAFGSLNRVAMKCLNIKLQSEKTTTKQLCKLNIIKLENPGL